MQRIGESPVRQHTTRIVGNLMEQVVQPVLAKAGHVLHDGKQQRVRHPTRKRPMLLLLDTTRGRKQRAPIFNA